MYNGYRVKINGKIISENLISRGSYSSQRNRRVLDEFYDAYGVKHETLSQHETVEISFELRERSMSEQNELSSIFSVYENVSVEYWDDISMKYKTGNFKMERPIFKHRNIQGSSINYAKTQIVLQEY